MRNLWLLLSCTALMISAPAFAAKKKTHKKGTGTTVNESANKMAEKGEKKLNKVGDALEGHDGYDTAGCGLGSIVFKEKTGMIQIVAATLNGTGVQTFGISTGTSNCKPDMYNFRRNAQLFINVNKEMLAKDISRGNGETLMSLSEVMGCSDAQALGGKLQQNFNKIFPNQDTSSDDASRSIFNLIKSDGELAKNCAKIG